MTIAARDNLAGERRFAKAAGPNPWRRLWQVPLLVIGVAAVGLGLRTLVRVIQPVPLAEQAKSVRLQMLAGDVHYLAQQNEPGLVRENYKRVTEHYGRAVAWGLLPGVEMDQRWGEAALALGDAKMAIEKLEAAIALAAKSSEAEGGR